MAGQEGLRRTHRRIPKRAARVPGDKAMATLHSKQSVPVSRGDGYGAQRPAMITGKSPPVAEEAQTVMLEPPAAADQGFADKLAMRSPPHPVERAQIEKARKRTKARSPRIAMHIKDRGTGVPTLYPDHSDEEGHEYRLADAFGTRSLQFVYSMLKAWVMRPRTLR